MGNLEEIAQEQQRQLRLIAAEVRAIRKWVRFFVVLVWLVIFGVPLLAALRIFLLSHPLH